MGGAALRDAPRASFPRHSFSIEESYGRSIEDE